jgi:RNA polymerase sigma factor (sigma-70 family)
MDTLATRATIFLRLRAEDTACREVAWDDFRKRYGPIIAGFARKLGVKGHDVDDVIQDVMLGFFSHSPNFTYDPAKGRFRGYLKVCTFRAVQRSIGRRARHDDVPLDEVGADSLQVEQAWSDVWEQEMLQQALQAARAELANDQAFRAFELHVLKGHSVAAVVRELNMSERTVYRATSRMTGLVRRQLLDLTGEDEPCSYTTRDSA